MLECCCYMEIDEVMEHQFQTFDFGPRREETPIAKYIPDYFL